MGKCPAAGGRGEFELVSPSYFYKANFLHHFSSYNGKEVQIVLLNLKNYYGYDYLKQSSMHMATE